MKSAIQSTVMLAFLSGCAVPPPKDTTQTAVPDNWQKMKDCAEQTDKVATDYQRRKMPMGAIPGSNWANHYNAKENRCYMELWYSTIGNDPGSRAVRDVSVHALEDAFDRKTVAMWADNGCEINGENADCAKVQQFIDEHMKN
jgi:hypothetical protein